MCVQITHYRKNPPRHIIKNKYLLYRQLRQYAYEFLGQQYIHIIHQDDIAGYKIYT